MAKAVEAFRTISEVAEELDLQKHVLRFWEVKFPQIKPMKRGGGRRYYRPADMDLLRGIRHLLHAEGYTIKGVQRILRDRGLDTVKRVGVEVAAHGSANARALIAADKVSEHHETSTVSAPQSDARHGLSGDTVAKAKRNSKAAAGDLAKIPNVLAAAIAELEACRAILLGVDVDEASTRTRTKRSASAAG